MSFRSFVRDLERAQRRAERNQGVRERAYARQERAVAVRQRELEKEAKALQKIEDAANARLEVARFENYLELLVSVHKQPGLAWDWQASAAAPPPPAPARQNKLEQWAAADRDEYVPGWLDRLFRRAERKAAALQEAVRLGREKDDANHAEATRKWKEAHAAWEHERAIGQRILARDHGAYADALEYAGAFDEVSAYGATVTVGHGSADAVIALVEIVDPEIVPTEILKLTASGKLSTKAMPKGHYWELYQDHVCSCALRVASEVFAALPVERVIVNTGTREISSTTGHPERVTHLAVHFAREQLARVNLERIDPSNCMSNFEHRTKFAKTTGFKPVEPITLDDQFVTT